MTRRETSVSLASAIAYLTVAAAIAIWLPSERALDPLVMVALAVGYVAVSQVKFEFGGSYLTPEQLVFVPMVLFVPLPLVPLLVGISAALAVVPDIAKGELHRDRWISAIGDCWFAVGPVLVLGAFAPGRLSVGSVEIYLAAYAAELICDFSWMLARDRLIDRAPVPEMTRSFLGTARVDVVLTPIAFLAALEATQNPLALISIAPLIWLLVSFSRDRRERYTAALELQRAYRGTVMLLADVVQHDDPYTAHHSRSVVDLVNAVADELNVKPEARRELEFAAMLHDVGKIAIPQEILNKPAKLSDDEFELIKTHTIEGQYMLDRVGGMLGRVGEMVRSCHERWDGGGYPDGLAGPAIPLEARIVFVCDAYHAMTSDRVYRKAMSKEDALLELAIHAGTQFDPSVVAALAQVVEQGDPARLPLDEIKGMLAASSTGPLAHKAGVSV